MYLALCVCERDPLPSLAPLFPPPPPQPPLTTQDPLSSPPCRATSPALPPHDSDPTPAKPWLLRSAARRRAVVSRRRTLAVRRPLAATNPTHSSPPPRGIGSLALMLETRLTLEPERRHFRLSSRTRGSLALLSPRPPLRQAPAEDRTISLWAGTTAESDGAPL